LIWTYLRSRINQKELFKGSKREFLGVFLAGFGAVEPFPVKISEILEMVSNYINYGLDNPFSLLYEFFYIQRFFKLP